MRKTGIDSSRNRELRLTAGKPIPLEEAPARFLEGDFTRLASLTGSDTKALEALSHPDPALLVAMRRQAIAAGRGGPEARVQEDIYARVENMIADFKALGASNEIAPYGVFCGTGMRQGIPQEVWSDLKFDFMANKATSVAFSYIHVAIEQVEPAINQADIVARIAAWLQARRSEHGDEQKKILAEAARAEFGGNYTERAFNDGYKQVYERLRGRPRRS